MSEIDDNVQRLLAQAMMDATAENLRAKEARTAGDEDLEDTAEFAPLSGDADEEEAEEEFPAQRPARISRIDFGELQFGRDYEIK